MKKLIAMLLLAAMAVSVFAVCVGAEATNGTAGCVDSQKNPDWLITEISEDQNGDGTKIEWYNTPYAARDIFEMIEIYNNSDEALNLYDYALAYNGDNRTNKNFEHQIRELTPFLTNNTYSDKPGNYFDGMNEAHFGPNGAVLEQANVGRFNLVMPEDQNPETCVVQPGECVVIWCRFYETYLSCYNDNPTTPEFDGIGVTMADFRKFWNVPEDVKVIMLDANSNTTYGGNNHNFNIKNTDCGTYSIVKYSKELDLACNTPTDSGSQSAGFMTEGYWTYDNMVCWASVDFTSSMPGKGNANLTYNFVPDVGAFSATRYGTVWSGGRMAILEYNAEPSVGYLTDLQKLYIAPETLSAGTSIPLNGNNAALYVFSFDWRTSTHRYNFYGFTINGQNYKWSTETFVVPAGGVTEFVPYYEEVELTTIPDDPEDEPTDDVTTTVKETETKAPDTTKAPETTLPKADDEKSGSCGGFTVAAQLIAVLCSTVAFVAVKKRK